MPRARFAAPAKVESGGGRHHVQPTQLGRDRLMHVALVATRQLPRGIVTHGPNLIPGEEKVGEVGPTYNL